MTTTDQKKRYTRLKNTLSLVDMLIGILFLGILALSPLSKVIAAYSMGVLKNQYLSFLVFAAICATLLWILSLPLSFISGYVIEKRYALSNQSLARWIGEELKNAAVAAVLTVPAVLAFYFFLQKTGGNWWVYFSAFIILFSILISFIAPVILLPLFHKIKPVENESLVNRLMTYAAANNIKIGSVNEFDISKNTKKANAAFTGFGRTKKIILGDTLLKDFTEDEILSVFAHESGHYLKKHIPLSLLLSAITIPLSLFLCSQLQQTLAAPLGFASPFEVAAIPLFILTVSLCAVITMPLMNSVSRLFERQADRFAIQTTNDPASFIAAMQKLSDMNLSDEKPNAVFEFLFYSHPSIQKRIDFAKKLQTEK